MATPEQIRVAGGQHRDRSAPLAVPACHTRRSSPSTASPPTHGVGRRSPVSSMASSVSWRSTCAAAARAPTRRAPYGIRQHADDVAAVIEKLDLGRVVITGHSMGAFVALLTAERHPALVADVVLVDGGVALPVPEGVDVQDVLDLTLGPAIERLRQTWPNRMAYRAMWEQHPAFAGGITPDIERYVLADLVEVDGSFRSSVSEEAVRFDGAELLTDAEVRVRVRSPAGTTPHRPRRARCARRSSPAHPRRVRDVVSAARVDDGGRLQPLRRADRRVGCLDGGGCAVRRGHRPIVTSTSASAAIANPISCGRRIRSPSSTVARSTVLAGYMATTTATIVSSPRLVASR